MNKILPRGKLLDIEANTIVMYSINPIAILVAAIASMGLGAFWYSPRGFGKTWMRLMGFTDEHVQNDQKRGMAWRYVFGFLSNLVMAFVLAMYIAIATTPSAFSGAFMGSFLWLGFIATVSSNSVLWEGKPWKLYFLNITYNLASLLLMGAIIGAWK